MSRLTIPLALLVLVAAAGPVAATPEEDQARALLTQCKQRRLAGDLEGALQCYREAYAHWANPSILINQAAMLWQLDRLVEAAQTYDLYLATSTDEAGRAEIGKALAELSAKLGALRIDAPPGARALVDNRAFPAPLPTLIRVLPGDHIVELLFDGGDPVRVVVTGIAGEVTTVTLPAVAAVEPPPEAPPVDDAPAPELPAIAPPAHRWRQRSGVYLDGRDLTAGAAGRIGVGHQLGAVGLGGGALVAMSPALWLDATWTPWRGAIAPYLLAGTQLVLARRDGHDPLVRPGVRGAIGVEVPLLPRIDGFAELGVEHTFAMPVAEYRPDTLHVTLLVPALGVKVRL